MWRSSLLLVLWCGCVSCIPYVKTTAQDATASAVATITDADSKKKLDAFAASVVGAARDEALSPETTARLKALVDALGADLRSQMVSTRDAVIDQTFHDDVAQLRQELLGAETRKLLQQLLHELLAELLAEVGPLREALVGPPLRQDVDAMLDDAAPRIDAAIAKAFQTALAGLQAQADAEISKYKTIAVVLGVMLLVILAGAVLLIRSHRRIIEALVAKR